VDRRRFFGRMLGGGTVLAAGGAWQVDGGADGFTVGGWTYRWIDWQIVEAQDQIYGVWVATSLGTEQRLAHWSTRGRGGWHFPGASFDLTGCGGWDPLDGGTDAGVRAERKARTLLALQEFLRG